MDPIKSRKKLILLVEDDLRLRTVYMAVLDSAGYEVRPAQDAEIALDLIKSLSWNLLLLDIMLPVTDGISILKTITEQSLKKGKVIMLTNLNNENIIQDAFKYGADGYLIKSEVTPGALVDEVKRFID